MASTLSKLKPKKKAAKKYQVPLTRSALAQMKAEAKRRAEKEHPIWLRYEALRLELDDSEKEYLHVWYPWTR